MGTLGQALARGHLLSLSPEEAGRYLETYKAYEQKPPDLLMEKVDQDFLSQVRQCYGLGLGSASSPVMVPS